MSTHGAPDMRANKKYLKVKELALKIIDIVGLYALFNRYTRNTGTVFMLHSIIPAQHKGHGVSTDLLRRFFDFLKKARYQVWPLADYCRALREHEDTHKVVVFTVDDGYRDFYLNAFPIFREYGYSATIFITSDFIERRLFFWWDTIEYVVSQTTRDSIDLGFMGGETVLLGAAGTRNDVISRITKYCKQLPNDDKLTLIDNLVKTLNVDISDQPGGRYAPLTWDEIHEMQAAGIDFHPHTKTHPIIARVPRAQKVEEVTVPKQVIEERLGTKADIFCYPNGQWDDFDEETIEVLKAAGYQAAVTGVEGFDDTRADNDMFRLRRFAIPDRMMWFKQYVSGLEAFKRRLRGTE